MKILIAVDKSNEAEEAFDFLLNIVSKADHVYIASLTSGLPVSCSLPAPMVDAAWAEIEKQVSALLEHFAERLIKQNVCLFIYLNSFYNILYSKIIFRSIG